MDKTLLPAKYQNFYDLLKTALTPEAFTIWYENCINNTQTPLPENTIKKQVTNKELAAQAVDAVAGYSETNGLRKAVEALAAAIDKGNN